MGRLDACTCIERYLLLRNEAIQVVFKTLWKRLGNLIERLGKLVEL
jgi:hypothetical protein